MKRVLAIILGGGAGTRLQPLTKMRAKPAVPLAGKYRLIDIPISNCINSDIHKMYVMHSKALCDLKAKCLGWKKSGVHVSTLKLSDARTT